jgi:long-chain acyl-CoA synthetase
MSDIYSEKPWLKHYDKNVPPTLEYEEKTFAEKFREIVEKYPDKTALIYMENMISFRQLDQYSNQLAAYLIKSGVKPNDVVGLCMPNIPAHYMSVVAVQKAGAVSTGLSPLLTPTEMEHQINDSGAKVIITMDLLFGIVAQAADRCDFTTVIYSEIADFLPGIKEKLAKAYIRQTTLGKLLKKVKKLDAKLSAIPAAPVQPIKGKTVIAFMDALKGMPSSRVEVKREMDDLIFLMYTGGTTGPSKGAMLTQRSYMSNRLQTLTYLDLKPDITALSAFPLFHIAGLALGGFSMTNGSTQIVVPNPRDTHFIIEAMEK